MKEVMQEINKFREDRDWNQYHTPRNLATSIIIEAGELMENFQWQDEPKDMVNVKEEIADVLIYTMMLADDLDLDLETIIREKIAKNALKYPLEK
ncbi:NTP pyrophosphatase, house-cleaning of non-canonical NTPs [Granulicatella balaenopterae]|uniref:NTP pyrophosphatase, house-cleaning of non-canonical NTPs n=1 Tax=Granulicatella balaenopterae TaxID=137733 RepID=A0A1H9GYA5_9LACT|nr:nucleotide pyrophosphohydrolase [Granulicatella balaenopterae]SEQ55025.1 NTP pyrophosphatase, house-cleaning of non-canonical NTPs [Granulicatella balaenopterae]